MNGTKQTNDFSHLENELHYIFSHVNEMLKFAEAKIAGLVAFNITIIIGVCQLNFFNSDSLFIKYFGIFVITVNVLSVFFLLYSIYAQLRPNERPPEIEKTDNLLFFGTIALLTPEKLLSEMKERYKFVTCNEQFEYDMARQVVIVSQITMRKFRLFNIAMYFTIATIPIFLIIIFLRNKYLKMKNDNKKS